MTRPDQIVPTLQQLGWKPFFQQQLSLDEHASLMIGRVMEQHRTGLVVMSDKGALTLNHSSVEPICVGDWLLFDHALKVHRCLERQSLFQRKSPGSKVSTQLIAANIDSAMIVCSLNYDFNLNRIERYLSLANEAQVEPVVILTKADLCEERDEKHSQVQALDPNLVVYSVNALDSDDLSQLDDFCRTGKTIVFLGSSGVGKSTLVNGLLGFESQQTAAIRGDDSKGRHTTTHRALKVLPQGGILMDTPGVRELQLSHCEQGVIETFSEISSLAEQCRFGDCSHVSEPDCAIQAAIVAGELSLRRLNSYQKLLREQAINGATLAERKSKDKAFGKFINHVQAASRRNKKGY